MNPDSDEPLPAKRQRSNWNTKLRTFIINSSDIEENVLRHVLVECKDLRSLLLGIPHDFDPELRPQDLLDGLNRSPDSLKELREVKLGVNVSYTLLYLLNR